MAKDSTTGPVSKLEGGAYQSSEEIRMTEADDLTRSDVINAFGEDLGGKIIAAGYSSRIDLSYATDEEILAIAGIGPAGLAKIREAGSPKFEEEVEEEAEVGLEEEAAKSEEVEETPEEEGADPVDAEPEVETEPEVEEAPVEEGQPEDEAPAEVLETEEAPEEAEEELPELSDLETGPPEPKEEELAALADLETGPVEPGPPVEPPPYYGIGDQPQVSVRIQRLRDAAAAAQVVDEPVDLPVDAVTVDAEIEVEEDEGLITGSASALDPSVDVPVVEETEEKKELMPEDGAAGIPVADSSEGGEEPAVEKVETADPEAEEVEAVDSEEAAPEIVEAVDPEEAAPEAGEIEAADPEVEPSE